MRYRFSFLILLLFVLFASQLGTSQPASKNAAALLGPSTSSDSELGPAANSSGGTSAGSQALQPTGSNSLQTGSGNTGLTSPDSSPLQAPAPNAKQLSVINASADGSPHQLGSDNSPWTWFVSSLILAILAAVGVWFIRRRSYRQKLRALDELKVADEPKQPPTDTIEESKDRPTRQELTITIDRQAADIFAFLLDPKNTPEWVASITSEETNEWPPKQGTIYKNQDETEQWSSYELTEFDPDKSFLLSKQDSSYRVRYSLIPHNDATELKYEEWVEEGALTQPFSKEELEQLKAVLEKDVAKKDETESQKQASEQAPEQASTKQRPVRKPPRKPKKHRNKSRH